VNTGFARAKQPKIEHDEGSGGQGRTPEPRFLAVGQVVGIHGLHGELKVKLLTDDPHRFALLERVYVGPDGAEPLPRVLAGYRPHKGNVLLKLEGCNDRYTANTLRGHLIQIPPEEAVPLEEDQYYEHQILGLQVRTISGESLGEIVEIIYTGANEVYVIEGPDPGQPQILIPAIKDVVLEVDLESGHLLVELPEGLL
jgi:16S rRNA processing protein RimM